MSKNNFKPIGRKSDIVIQELQNETLIYDLRINKAFCLNPTSSIIWQACDGINNVTEIANQVSKQMNSSTNEDFVWFALEQLKKENLIENSEFSAPFEDLSRREVIRKIGLSSAVALPLISFIIAPTSVQAGGSIVCVTAGNTACRCPCPGTPINGTCGLGTSTPSNAACNPNCTCTRTGISCPATGPSAGTALGACG